MPSFTVTMECTVTKVVCVDAETEDEARKHPWRDCSDERETGMSDWEVLKVEPND